MDDIITNFVWLWNLGIGEMVWFLIGVIVALTVFGAIITTFRRR